VHVKCIQADLAPFKHSTAESKVKMHKRADAASEIQPEKVAPAAAVPKAEHAAAAAGPDAATTAAKIEQAAEEAAKTAKGVAAEGAKKAFYRRPVVIMSTIGILITSAATIALYELFKPEANKPSYDE
jgi:hypothetical protein